MDPSVRLQDLRAQVTAASDQALAAALGSDQSAQEIEDWLAAGLRIAGRLKRAGVNEGFAVSMLVGAFASRLHREL